VVEQASQLRLPIGIMIVRVNAHGFVDKTTNG
jgi:hypothetical protein